VEWEEQEGMAHHGHGEVNVMAAYSEAELQFLTRIVKRQGVAWDTWGNSRQVKYFARWHQVTLELRKVQEVAEERVRVKQILRMSERGSRSDDEKEILRKFCTKLQVFPKELSDGQLDILCNDVDIYPVEGKSLVFLQGDFGNVYYVIATGEVALYLQSSKDQEMEIAREFGHQRGKPFRFAFEESLVQQRVSSMNMRASQQPDGVLASAIAAAAVSNSTGAVVPEEGPSLISSSFDPAFLELKRQEELSRLGVHIVTLKAGYGFGEAAILSTKSKLRGASAFSATEDTFLLVLHADVYNAVLKQVHYRQKQLASCTSLLKELPLFRHYPYPRLSQIAFVMTSSQYSLGGVVREAGSPVDCVVIINTGSVKQLQPGLKGRLKVEATETETLTRRLPLLAFSVLGRGCVLGEAEAHQHLDSFRYTYVANSNDCEAFMMPLNVYLEHAASPEVRALDLFRAQEVLRNHTDSQHTARIGRAVRAIRDIVVSEAEANDERKDILRILPLLVDGLDVDDTTEWDPSLKKGVKAARGFRHEKATAASFLKEPETTGHISLGVGLVTGRGDVGANHTLHPTPPPAGSPRGSTAAKLSLHFRSKLVSSTSSSAAAAADAAAAASSDVASLRLGRFYTNKKHFKPSSEQSPVMRFGSK